jgi:hypothetical protein
MLRCRDPPSNAPSSSPHARGDPGVEARGRTKIVNLALALMGMLFAVDQTLVNLFGHGKG